MNINEKFVKTLDMKEKRRKIMGVYLQYSYLLLISQLLFIIHFKTLYQTIAYIMILDLYILNETRKSALRGTYTPGWCVIDFDL